jgi:hypothetical protein
MSRKQKVLMAAVLLAAAAGTLGARAAEPGRFAEHERETTGGYYPEYGATDPTTGAETSEAEPGSMKIVDTIAFDGADGGR